MRNVYVTDVMYGVMQLKDVQVMSVQYYSQGWLDLTVVLYIYIYIYIYILLLGIVYYTGCPPIIKYTS